MPFTSTSFVSAILLVSDDARRLAKFYRDTLKVPLKDEEHGDLKLHYGCELGDLHFAIHPPENFENRETGVGSVRLAFEVFDIEDFASEMEKKNVPLLYPPKDVGFMKVTALNDPDGNLVEITQLSPKWYQYLEKRRGDGHCMIESWKERKP